MKDEDFLSLTPGERDFWRFKFERRVRFVVPGIGMLVIGLFAYALVLLAFAMMLDRGVSAGSVDVS